MINNIRWSMALLAGTFKEYLPWKIIMKCWSELKRKKKDYHKLWANHPKVRPFRENKLKKGTVSYYYFNGWQRLIIHIACTQPSELITWCGTENSICSLNWTEIQQQKTITPASRKQRCFPRDVFSYGRWKFSNTQFLVFLSLL